MSSKLITMAIVAEHNREEDAWIVVDGVAYDCTKWLPAHPGGKEVILNVAGKDTTEKFNSIHSKSAKEMLKTYAVGPVQKDGPQLTMTEVAKHNKADDMWIVIEGNVYDVTKWQDAHPGGKPAIVRNAGQDCTAGFLASHEPSMRGGLKNHLIGPLVKEDEDEEGGITMEEVAKHNTATDLWIVVDGNAYDVTKWQAGHPGGAAALLRVGGTDCTTGFFASHEPSMRGGLKNHLIGPVVASSKKAPEAPTVKFVVEKSESISHNTRRIVFKPAAGEAANDMELVPGGHMQLAVGEGSAAVARNYTPVEHSPKGFEIVVKKYPDGKGSGALHQLAAGETAVFRGPLAPSYKLRERRVASDPTKAAIKKLILIAGGTGIAPMFSLARAAIQETPAINTIRLFSCVRDEEDVLMESDVEGLLKQWSGLHHSFIFSRQKAPAKKKHQGDVFFGRIDSEMVAAVGVPRQWEDGVEVVVCGPPSFNDAVGDLFTKKLGYPADKVSLM